MARGKVTVDPQAIRELLADNKGLRDALASVANDVANVAVSTASAAENGPGGRLDGYAAAGFSVRFTNGGPGRPGFEVHSNADPMTAMAAHFHTQKRDGVAHLRAALYSQTSRGN
jgi:hypothetical protein|tara:strand:- start:2279 stop:2623 length:345 start_codon:yes stop_codon:yes gene_type:complete